MNKMNKAVSEFISVIDHERVALDALVGGAYCIEGLLNRISSLAGKETAWLTRWPGEARVLQATWTVGVFRSLAIDLDNSSISLPGGDEGPKWIPLTEAQAAAFLVTGNHSQSFTGKDSERLGKISGAEAYERDAPAIWEKARNHVEPDWSRWDGKDYGTP